MQVNTCSEFKNHTIMQVILSNLTLSLTGMLERGTGYHIQQRKNGFFAKRNSKGPVPPDGHWRFIVLCAELAQNGFPITDILVSRNEVKAALTEAHILPPDSLSEAALGCSLFGATPPNTLNAEDIMSLSMSIRSDVIRQNKGASL